MNLREVRDAGLFGGINSEDCLASPTSPATLALQRRQTTEYKQMTLLKHIEYSSSLRISTMRAETRAIIGLRGLADLQGRCIPLGSLTALVNNQAIKPRLRSE